MTPVGAYLKKLLFQYDCVVVPELGAFLTHYLPAAYSADSGLYLPPRKRLAFNEALRLDDGILTNYIMLHERVTREAALRYINAFVAQIRQQVRQEGSVALDGIGLLSLNDEGRMQFDPELRHNFNGESYGLQPLAATPCEAAPALAAVPVLSEESTAVDVSRPEAGRVLPMPRRRTAWRWAAAVLLVGSLGLISYFSVVQSADTLQSSLSPASLLRLPTALLPLPVATPKPDAKPTAAVPVAPVTVAAAPVKPAAAPVVVPRAAPVAPVVTARSAEVRPEARTYYTIIAGSFAKRGNALRLQRKLRRAGFSDAYIIKPARPTELIKVAAFGAPEREEAAERLASVSRLAGTQACIVKLP